MIRASRNDADAVRLEDAVPSRQVKVLKFVTGFAVGGTERLFMDLGRGLDPARFALYHACFRRLGSFLQELELRQVPVVEYWIAHLYGPRTLGQQLRFIRYLKDTRIDIVHTYGFDPTVFAIPTARVAGTPVVTSIQDLGTHLSPLKRRVMKAICGWADCIIANAEAVRQRLIAEGYDPARIAVIRSGVDISRFAKVAGNGLRRELGLPPRNPLVVVLSRLDRAKGLEHFLEAAAIVAGRFPDTCFLIVGEHFVLRNGALVRDGEYRKELEALAARLGLSERVVFTGLRTDIPEVLSEATISVLPSLSEGLSTAILESMAAGVPVVATSVGGNPEAVQDGGTGLLVPPRDPAALARAMCLVLENRELAFRFGQAGRQRATTHFSLDRMVRETEHVYGTLVRAPRAVGRRAEGAWARGEISGSSDG